MDNIILNGKNTKQSLLKSLSFNVVLEALAIAIRHRQEIKRPQIGKQVKLSLFADDIIRDPQNSIRKHKMINRFSMEI